MKHVKGKLTAVIGAAAGYVLGSRAGRERYEQIKSTAAGVWNNPKVQDKVQAAESLAKDKAQAAESVAKEKAQAAAGSVKETVKDKVSSNDTTLEAVPEDALPPEEVIRPS